MALIVSFSHIDGEIFIQCIKRFVVQEKVYILIFKTSAFDKQRNRKSILRIFTSNNGVKAMNIYKRQKPLYTNLFLFLCSHKDPA